MRKHFLLAVLALISFQISSKDILYSVGDIVADFTLLNINGSPEFKLSSLQNKKAVVFYFTDGQCPYAKITDDVIKEQNEKYADKNISFIAINSNPAADQQQLLPVLKNKQIKFPYLLDAKQVIAKQFSIVKVPAIVILKKAGPNFILGYRGAINANASNPTDSTGFYMKDALDAILLNRSVKANETTTRGCTL